ncbi:probable serine/threonine-protein kinase nek3 [Patella vulgata]|uniref:probable serine/threonine-protein kinase nek3 n=1 Tax=Patella vulgata TaxID=6465 RepID=UPI0024A926A1|nr:probable serine/threonine-protein kinase nek3 [Patella vulgata]
MAASNEGREQLVPDKVPEAEHVNGIGPEEKDTQDVTTVSKKSVTNGSRVTSDTVTLIDKMLPEDNLKVVENNKTLLNHDESKANNNNSNTNDVKSIETSSDVNVNNNKVEEENGITNAIPSPLVVSTNGVEIAEETNSENKLFTVTDTPVEQSNTETFLPKISQEPKAANSKTQNNVKSVPKARKSGAPVSNAINIKMVNLAPIANMKVKVSDLENALNCDSSSSKVLDSTKVTSENNIAPSETSSSSKGGAKQTSAKSKKFKFKKLKKRKSGNYDFPNKKKNYKKKKFEMTSGDVVEESSEKTVDESFTNLRTDEKTVNKKVKSGIKSPDRTFMDILSRNNHLAFKRRSKFGCKKVLQSKSFKGKSVMDLLRKNSLSPNSKIKTELVSPSKDTDSSASGTDLDLSKESVGEENNEQSLANRKRKSEITEENPNVQEESDFSQSTVFLAGSVNLNQPSIQHSAIHHKSLRNTQNGKKRKTDESGNMTPIITVVPEVKTSPTPSGLRSLLPPHLQQSSQPNNAADTNKPQPIANVDQPNTKSKGLAKPMGANAKPSISSLATKNSEALRALLVSGPTGGIPRDLSTFNNIVGGFTNNVGKDMKPGLTPNTPNGLTYPVTPPKTPDNDAMNTQCISPDRDIIPLCCCKINGAAFNKLATGTLFCQALDTVDRKVMGCCNKVTNTQLVRPGVKIPFMAICEAHRLKLKAHQCCPGCGHYCTQGKFYQCRKEGPSIHNFHKQCQVFKDGKYYCPHCGEESLQFEVTLSLNDEPSTLSDTASTTQGRISKRQTAATSIAKMSLLGGYKEKGSEKETPGIKYSLGSKTISLDSLPSGPDKKTLQKILDNLGQERPKKYRNLSKSLYQPAYDGEVEKCIYILMDGSDPNQRYSEHEDQTAIHAAANSGHLAIVHILVQCGAVVHIQDKTLRTPLMCATENDNKSIIQYLVNAGASVDERGEDGMTVLHYAAKLGSMAVIQYLVEVRKMSVNITDDGGWTPMIWAAESKYVDTVRYLMSHGADPGMKDDVKCSNLV